MNIGRMSHRVTLQRRATADDALGQPVGAWQNVATVWADAQPLRGREWFAAEAAQSSIDVKFTIRHRPDVTSAMRVVWSGAPHDIRSVIDVGGKGEALELMAVRGEGDGK